MPRILKPNQNVRKYKIVREMSKGMFALAYEAQDDKGTRVFFKQYKSPTPEVPWYKGFVSYQKALKDKLQGSGARELSLECVDSFEEKVGTPTFFQVFEFFPRGMDLKAGIGEFRRRAANVPWERRLVFARVFVSALTSLHEAGIVHCDLKPENVYLVEDKTLSTGYKVKLIDLDFSILTDKTAPWEGAQNYVGSPTYMSPEHLDGKAVPQPRSDVFTAALMLHELLGTGHPYPDEELYPKQVMAHKAPRIKFEGKFEAKVDEPRLAELIHLALSPDMSKRPSTQELKAALLGLIVKPPPPPPKKTGREKEKEKEKAPPVPPPLPLPPPEKPKKEKEKEKAPPPPLPSGHTTLKLVLAPGKEAPFNVERTEVGKAILRSLDPEAHRWVGDVQFTIHRKADGSWVVIPHADVRNQTLLNGKAVTAETTLKPGDVLSVGNERTGNSKLPMTVQIVGGA